MFETGRAQLLRRIDQSTVDYRAAQVLQVHSATAAHALDHADEDDIVRGIDPEPGAGCTIPEECALALRQVRCRRVENHGAVVAVAEAGPHGLRSDAKFAR